jgi:hypothetical protein
MPAFSASRTSRRPPVVDRKRMPDTFNVDWTGRRTAADLGFLVFRVVFAGCFFYLLPRYLAIPEGGMV